MLFSIHGLSIFSSETPAPEDEADLVWLQSLVPEFVSVSGSSVEAALFQGAPGTQLTFASQSVAYCRFHVSQPGDLVVSQSIPAMLRSNLYGLFAETVMRTVLYRRGLPSFHAAALSRKGQAILLMGPKGAGKSTLSAALQQAGWSLMADDLVRVSLVDGEWHAFPGLRRTKLHADSLLALGQSPESTEPRWAGDALAGHSASSFEEKLLLPATSADADLPPSLPVTALFSLQERSPAGSTVAIRPLPQVHQVLALAEHVTRDPLAPGTPPSPAMAAALGGLLAQAPVYALTLPDSLPDLLRSASVLEELLTSEALLPSGAASLA